MSFGGSRLDLLAVAAPVLTPTSLVCMVFAGAENTLAHSDPRSTVVDD